MTEQEARAKLEEFRVQVDDVELNQHSWSSGIVYVVDPSDGAVDPDDLPGTFRRSLHAQRCDIHFGGLLHHNRRGPEELNRDLAFERAARRENRQAGGCDRGQDQSSSAQSHAADQSTGGLSGKRSRQPEGMRYEMHRRSVLRRPP